MHAVAFVGPSWYDLAQEHDFASFFGDGYIHTANAWQQLCYLNEFMVVRGEECACATAFVIVQVFDNGTSDGKPIIGAGATPNLVKDDQAARRGVVQDVSRLDHLDHKGALPRCQVVLCADARKNAVYQSNHCRLGG